MTYASTNGGSSASTTYEGSAYAVTSSAVSGSGYTSNTSTAEWIVAPGAYTSTSARSYNLNTGGNYLPGNGTGSNEGIYVYTLAFNISQTGVAAGGKITAPLSINMTIAADDGYAVYLNPLGYNKNPTSAPTNYGTAISSNPQGEWTGTTQLTVNTSNATFYNGVNYLSIVVDNTNGISGSSSATDLNESGLLVFDTTASNGSTAIWSNGAPVPEVGAWIPVALAVGIVGFHVYRRRSSVSPA